MENYSAGCDFRKSSDTTSDDNSNVDTNGNDNNDNDNDGDDDDNKSTDTYSRFQPGIVAPPSDETESRLYRIF